VLLLTELGVPCFQSFARLLSLL